MTDAYSCWQGGALAAVAVHPFWLPPKQSFEDHSALGVVLLAQHTHSGRSGSCSQEHEQSKEKALSSARKLISRHWCTTGSLAIFGVGLIQSPSCTMGSRLVHVMYHAVAACYKPHHALQHETLLYRMSLHLSLEPNAERPYSTDTVVGYGSHSVWAHVMKDT